MMIGQLNLSRGFLRFSCSRAQPAVGHCLLNQVPLFLRSRQGRHLWKHALNHRTLTRSAGDDDTRLVSKSLKETAALDQFIDALLASKSKEELTTVVAENILSCDQRFWMRLATRSDTAATAEEKEKLSALASTVMFLVDAMVKKTESQLNTSASLLQDILKAGADENGEWNLPLAPEKLQAMRQVMLDNRSQLDEALLSNAFAWMRKASDDKLDGMVSLLQKVLQLYAGIELSRFGAAGTEEERLNGVLQADEEEWEDMLRGWVESGAISPVSFQEALQKRMESTVLGVQSGSYAQRVQAEYLKELESRAKQVFQQCKSTS